MSPLSMGRSWRKGDAMLANCLYCYLIVVVSPSCMDRDSWEPPSLDLLISNSSGQSFFGLYSKALAMFLLGFITFWGSSSWLVPLTIFGTQRAWYIYHFYHIYHGLYPVFGTTSTLRSSVNIGNTSPHPPPPCSIKKVSEKVGQCIILEECYRGPH